MGFEVLLCFLRRARRDWERERDCERESGSDSLSEAMLPGVKGSEGEVGEGERVDAREVAMVGDVGWVLQSCCEGKKGV